MQRVQEVSDELFETVKAMMIKSEEWNNPSFDEIFDMALEVKERMSDCGMNAKEAFFDIMY